MSTPSTPTLSASSPRATACSLCQKRKIKCDQEKPCGNCVKAQVPCVAAPPPLPRRRRQPNAELRTRLARCEILLEQFSGPESNPHSPVQYESPDTFQESPSARSDAEVGSTSTRMLVDEYGTTRFTDSAAWGMVSDEIKAMQSILGDDNTAPQEEDGPDLAPRTTGCAQCLRVLDGEEDRSRPSATELIRLWQIFLDRVHPLTKVIHAPSFQSHVVDATADFRSQPWNIRALLYAICNNAVISMEEDECTNLLGLTRDEACRKYAAAGRTVLHRHSFIRNNDLTTLQALVLFMLSTHGRTDPRSSFILNGFVVRIAQGLGLHKDGEVLGLPPFETEMRRRVWWHIVMLDLHTSFSSGLVPPLPPRFANCKLPTNLNDSDMNPGATQYYTDRQGPTEMIICLLTYGMGKYLMESPSFHTAIFQQEAQVLGINSYDPRLGPEPTPNLINQTLDDIMNRFSHPSAGPVHEFASQLRLNLAGKLYAMFPPAGQEPDGTLATGSPQDRLFNYVVTDIRHAMSGCEKMSKRSFAWYLRMFFSQKAFFYMVGQLCQRTSGELVNQAWKNIVDAYRFFPDLMNLSLRWNSVLATLVLRAWQVREATLLTMHGRPAVVPACVEILRQKLLENGGSTENGDGAETFARNVAPGGYGFANYNPFGQPMPGLDDIDEAQMDWGMWAASNVEGFENGRL